MTLNNQSFQKLEPVGGSCYTHAIESKVAQLADVTNKRVGGGRCQFNIINYEDLAEILIPKTSGFDKKMKSDYNSKTHVLDRYLSELGIPKLNNAITTAYLTKYVQDPDDGFIPLALGTTDIEAGLQPEGPQAHREIQIRGIPKTENEEFKNILSSKFGFATEYGNGDSLEIIAPMYTPGVWTQLNDLEFQRGAIMAISTPYADLWVRQPYNQPLSINNLSAIEPNLSVKAEEALKISHAIINEMDLN